MAVLSTLLTACHSQTTKINGTADGYGEGDTLFITSDLTNGTPSDTIIVHNGKFSYECQKDSVLFCYIYSSKGNTPSFPFFIEPGEIDMNIGMKPQTSVIKGTVSNNKLQELRNIIFSKQNKMDSIMSSVYDSNLSEQDQKKKMSEIKNLNSELNTAIIHAANDNLDNEFGFFLVTAIESDVMSDDIKAHLISAMPDKFKNRKAVKELFSQIMKNKNTSIGKRMPIFQLKTPSGKLVSIYDEIKKNKITIIDFWASWCAPCRKEMPNMVSLYSKYHKRGLGIVGISLDSNKSDWEQAIKDLNISWCQLSDLNGWENMAAQIFGVSAIPYTIIVDNDGVILQKDIRGDELKRFVIENF